MMGLSLLCAQYIDVKITHHPIYQPAYHITAGLPLLFADWHFRHDTQTDLNVILLAFDRHPTSTVKVHKHIKTDADSNNTISVVMSPVSKPRPRLQ